MKNILSDNVRQNILTGRSKFIFGIKAFFAQKCMPFWVKCWMCRTVSGTFECHFKRVLSVPDTGLQNACHFEWMFNVPDTVRQKCAPFRVNCWRCWTASGKSAHYFERMLNVPDTVRQKCMPFWVKRWMCRTASSKIVLHFRWNGTKVCTNLGDSGYFAPLSGVKWPPILLILWPLFQRNKGTLQNLCLILFGHCLLLHAHLIVKIFSGVLSPFCQ